MLGGFQKKFAVNGCRETSDNDGCHVLQRKFFFTFRRLARQLSVLATNRTLRRVYADDVVGHDAMPVKVFFRIVAFPFANALIESSRSRFSASGLPASK